MSDTRADNLVYIAPRAMRTSVADSLPLIMPEEGLNVSDLPPAEDVQRQILAELRETNRLLRRALGIR